MFPEFALAMYLCNLKLVGKELPSILPEKISNEVSSMVDIISFAIPEEESSTRKANASSSPLSLGNSNASPALKIQQPQPQQSNSQLLSQLTPQPTAFQGPPGIQVQPTAQAGAPNLQPQATGYMQNNNNIGGYTGPRPPMPPMPTGFGSSLAPNVTGIAPLNSQPTGRPGQWGLVNAPSTGLPNIDAHLCQQSEPLLTYSPYFGHYSLVALMKKWGKKMQFEYPSLEALSAVVREGTFEAAARSLNITQSAVSQRIKQLEEKSGAILIVRGRPCVATEYGRRLCRHIDEVRLLEHDLDRTLSQIEDPRSAAPALIRIAVNSDSLATWFPEVIVRAGREHNIAFDIVPDDQDFTAERLRKGEALAAVTTSDKPMQGCKRTTLGDMGYIAVCSPRFYEDNFADGITLEKVSESMQLVYDRKDTLPQHWMIEAFSEPAPVRCHWLPSFSGFMACCLNGAGWGLMPRAHVKDFIDQGALIDMVPEAIVSVRLHWQSSAQGSEIMKLLSATVQEVAREALEH